MQPAVGMPGRPPKAHCKADQAAEVPAGGEWYAVTEGGDSALRIAAGLTLGEHPDGALALNARAPEARWVRFEFDDGRAVLKAADPCRLVGDDAHPLDVCPLSNGLCLQLPHNVLRISRSIRPPAASGPTLTLAPAADSATRHGPGGSTSQAVHPANLPNQTLATNAASARSAAHPQGYGLRPAAALMLGIAALSAAGLAWWLEASVEPSASAEVAAPQVPAGGRPLQPESAAPDSAPRDAAPRDSAALAPQPAASPGPGAPARPVALIRLPPLAPRLLQPTAARPAAAADFPADPRLEIARQHLEAGRITYPPDDNAVALALAVLREYPGHPGAMDVLGRSTVRLLGEARALREAGENYQARNTLEEVLGFNPEHPDARRLWEAWEETPR